MLLTNSMYVTLQNEYWCINCRLSTGGYVTCQLTTPTVQD